MRGAETHPLATLFEFESWEHFRRTYDLLPAQSSGVYQINSPVSQFLMRTGITLFKGMSFEDLPPNAKDLPLTDRRLAADVIDLIIAERDRAAGCFGVMVCDEHHRGLQPIVVNQVPDDAEAADLASFLDLLLPLVSQNGGSIIVGRGRPEGRRPRDRDREWHQQAIDSCRTVSPSGS